MINKNKALLILTLSAYTLSSFIVAGGHKDRYYREEHNEFLPAALATVGIVGIGACIASAVWSITNWSHKNNAKACVKSNEQKYNHLISLFDQQCTSRALDTLIDDLKYYPVVDVYCESPLAKFYDETRTDVKKLQSWQGYGDSQTDWAINRLTDKLTVICNHIAHDMRYQKQATMVIIRSIKKEVPFLERYSPAILDFFNAWSKQESTNLLVDRIRQNDEYGVYKNYPLAKFKEDLDTAIKKLERLLYKESYKEECRKFIDDLTEIRYAIRTDVRFIEELRAVEKRREQERQRLAQERQVAEMHRIERRLADMEYEQRRKNQRGYVDVEVRFNS